MEKRVEDAINLIKPLLEADGGSIELVSVEDDTVKVRLTGACGSCPMSQITLTQTVERAIKNSVPEITRVIAV